MSEDKDIMVRERKRSAEILAVFAAHNFYATGFTPKEMRTTLEDLGPTYVKIGQILSSRTDILPEDYCAELTKLRTEVVPLPAEVAREVIEAETGRSIDDVYSEFRDEPLGSASIGQAHYGVLKDGTRVVTKVQRPLIADMMRCDFVVLRKLVDAVSVVRGTEDDSEGGVDFGEVLKELERVTAEELDFRVEAAHTREFRERCIEDPSVISCPEIIDDLTTERILTMTYVEGYSISHVDKIDADGYDRNAIGEAIINNYLHQILDVGIFHGDPHQGNIMVSSGVPYWIDFGMMGHVDERTVNVLQTMILSLVGHDAEALADATLVLGQTHGKVDKFRLVEDVDGLIDRYATAGSLADLDIGALMGELTELMDDHKISMPGDYTMLVRGLVTLEGVIEELCPNLDIFGLLTKRMIERAQADFDLKAQLINEAQELANTGMRVAKLPSLTYDVLRNLAKGRMKVNLELTGYEIISSRVAYIVQSVLMAAFACMLFLGGCLLCGTDIGPRVQGVPAPGLVCFVVAVALGIYSVRRMRRMP